MSQTATVTDVQFAAEPTQGLAACTVSGRAQETTLDGTEAGIRASTVVVAVDASSGTHYVLCGARAWDEMRRGGPRVPVSVVEVPNRESVDYLAAMVRRIKGEAD